MPRIGLPTFVFVHGLASTARIWQPLQRELALLGHRSLAVDLPGHGMNANHPAGYYLAPTDLDQWAQAPSALAEVTFDDYVRHVTDTVRRVGEHGPVVLAGTSAGGVTISAVANEAPQLIDRLIYMSAWCSARETVIEAASWPEQTSSLFDKIVFPPVGDPERLGAIRANVREPTLFAEMKAAMMADGTDDEFRALVNTLEPDVSLVHATARAGIQPETWGKVPHSYIRFTADRAVPIAVQDRLIAEADALVPDNPFDVHSIDSSHVGYFNRPSEFAALLNRIWQRSSTVFG